MKKWLVGIGVAIVALFLFVVLPIWTTYNGMVMAGNTIDKTWQDVQAAYQRRYDTVPKFAEVAKLSMDTQTKIKTDWARLREGYGTATTPDAINKLNQQASLIYANFRTEVDPKLDTTQLTELNAGIDNAERVINNERKVFNSAILTYNNKVKTFPGNVVAGWFGFEAKTGFTAEVGAEKSPPLNLTK